MLLRWLRVRPEFGERKAGQVLPWILVGNQSDLDEQREVSRGYCYIYYHRSSLSSQVGDADWYTMFSMQ